MKRVISYAFLSIGVIICLTGCSTVKGFKLWLPEWFGLERIADHVFVDYELPEVQQEEWLLRQEVKF